MLWCICRKAIESIRVTTTSITEKTSLGDMIGTVQDLEFLAQVCVIGESEESIFEAMVSAVSPLAVSEYLEVVEAMEAILAII